MGAGVALGLSVTASRVSHAMGSVPPSHGGGTPCFLAGTRIRTSAGLVAVEDLRIGDVVLTVTGKEKSIKWIGKQDASSEAPVKIAKFAIDGKSPTRDLYVSPRHAIYIDGYLIPAIDLVNDITVVNTAKSEPSTFSYYHIEFETHEVIEAEGLTVESYLAEAGVDFGNSAEYEALYGPREFSMAPFAPILSFKGKKEQLASYARSAVACFYDMRAPLDRIRDRVVNRAEPALGCSTI